MQEIEALKTQLNEHAQAMLDLIYQMPVEGDRQYACQKVCLIAHLRDFGYAIEDINTDVENKMSKQVTENP